MNTRERKNLGSKVCLILFQRAMRHHAVQSMVAVARQIPGATAAVYSNSPHEEQSDFQICLNSWQRNGKHKKTCRKKQAKKIYFFPFSFHLLNKISMNKKCTSNKSTLRASSSGSIYYSTYMPVAEQMREKKQDKIEKLHYSFKVVGLFSHS